MMYLASIRSATAGAKENDYIQQHNSFVNSIFEEMNDAIANANELIEFNIFTEDAHTSLSAAIVNGVRRIGQKILEMIERIKQFVRDMVDKFKAAAWDQKTAEQQLREVLRKYPDRAEEIKVAVSRGELAFPSYKDLKEFYENVDEILSEIKKDRVDPTSLRGKWEKAKAAINDNEKLIKNVSVAVGIVATAVTCYLKLGDFLRKKPERDRQYVDAAKGNTEMRENLKAALFAIEKVLEKINNDQLRADKLSQMQLLNEICVEADRITNNHFSSYYRLNKDMFVAFSDIKGDIFHKISTLETNLKQTVADGEKYSRM